MTVLFLEDYAKYGAFPNWDTDNASAIRISTALKYAGVKNHTFMLSLYDRDLVGINPHDPNLSIEMQAKVVREFSKNYWFAVRECIRIPPVVGLESVPYNFHRSNVSLAWLYLARVFNMSVIARQRGKTMSTVALLTWLLNTRANLTISSITKDDDLRASTIRTFRKVYDELPPYLQFRNKSDSRNNSDFTINGLKNIIKILVSSLSPKRAALAGRGAVTSTTWIDEAGFIPNARIAVGTCIASGTYAREAAAQQGQPSGIIMTTTAGRLDDPDGAYAYNIAENSTVFNEGLYDAADIEDLHETIRSNNPLRLVRTYSVFNHLQLGITNREQLNAMRVSTQSKSEAERDFLSIWNHGNAKSTLPEHVLKIINENIIDPLYWQLTPEKYAINWYVGKEELPYIQHEPMVCGLDPSDSLGSDSMGLVITSASTGQVIATADVSLTSIPAYARWLYVTFIKTFPNLVTIIEARSSGMAIIDALIELLIADGFNPFERIYNVIYDRRDEFKEQYELVRPGRFRAADHLHVHYKRFFGYKTSGTGAHARAVLYGELYYSTCERYGHLFMDRRLCQQISSLIEKNGKITHPAGAHDDLVIAMLLTHFFLQRVKNVQAFGISPTQILRQAVSKTDSADDQEAAYVLNIYTELLNQLRTTDNQWLRKAIIHKLRNILLQHPDVETSAPQTLREIIEERNVIKQVNRAVAQVDTGHSTTFKTVQVGR